MDLHDSPFPARQASGATEGGPRAAIDAEALGLVLDSLLHLLPTSASFHGPDGSRLLSRQASPLCRLLAADPAPGRDRCAEDCQALAREALAASRRTRGTCSAGLPLVAEPLAHCPGAPPAGVLVAAVGDAPRDIAHWQRVADWHGRPLDPVLAAAAATARTGLRGWEGEERFEVAASVLARMLGPSGDGTARPELTEPGVAPESEEDRTRRLMALQALASRACAALAVDEALDAVVGALRDGLGYTRTAIFLHDDVTGEIRGMASRGRGADTGRARTITGPLAAFPAAIAAAEARAAILVGPSDGGFPETYRERFGVTSVLVSPLLAHGRLLGFLAADKGGEPFAATPTDLAFATLLSQPASLAIEHARLHDEGRHPARVLAAAGALARLALQTSDSTTLEQAIASELRTLAGPECALLVPDGDGLRTCSSSATFPARVDADDAALGDSAVARRLTLEGLDTPLARQLVRAGCRHLAAAPLIARGDLVGWLVAAQREDSERPHVVTALAALSVHAALVLAQGVPGSASRATPSTTPRDVTGGGTRTRRSVLVVDDHQDTRVATGELVRRWGHEVRLAATAQLALELAREKTTDVVITDLDLPDLGGWDLAARLRELSPPPTIVIVTGWVVEDDGSALRRRGVRAVLEKPASPAVLRRLIESDGAA